MRCNACNNCFHQKCSTVPKASTRDQWKCNECNKLQQNRLDASTNYQLSTSTTSTPSQPQPVTFWKRLKIYKWNAEGIRPKFLKLCNLLINSDIDVLAIQESKLRKADKTLFIEGYATVQKYLNKILEGGTLFFIQTDVVSEKLLPRKKASTKNLSICQKTNKSTWLERYNIYLLNNSTQHNFFDLFLIKPGLSSFILNDFNDYSQI